MAHHAVQNNGVCQSRKKCRRRTREWTWPRPTSPSVLTHNATAWRGEFSVPESRRRQVLTQSTDGGIAAAANGQNGRIPTPCSSPTERRECHLAPLFQGRSGATAATSASDATVLVFYPKAEVHVQGRWNYPLVPICRIFRAPAFQLSKFWPAGKAPAPDGSHLDAPPDSMKEIGHSRPVERHKSGKVNEDDRSSRNQM